MNDKLPGPFVAVNPERETAVGPFATYDDYAHWSQGVAFPDHEEPENPGDHRHITFGELEDGMIALGWSVLDLAPPGRGDTSEESR